MMRPILMYVAAVIAATVAIACCCAACTAESTSVAVVVEAETSAAESTAVVVEAETSAAENTAVAVEAETILSEIDQYKAEFISGEWDGSPLFIGGNVLSIEKFSIWLNNEPIEEPLYCSSGKNEYYYPIDEDDTFMYYYKDVESETSETKDRYYIIQVNKKTGTTSEVEIPEQTYSAKIAFKNAFVKGEYSLYKIDFSVSTPEAVLLNNVVSDFTVLEYNSSIEVRYITGDRLEHVIYFNKKNGDITEECHQTNEARYSYSTQGKVTFFDNELYCKARELLSTTWDGEFVDLHTFDESVPENTFAKKSYDGNIIINNKVEGRFFRAMQVQYGYNIYECYNGSTIWFEEGFNEYLRFYFPGQQEEYRVHSYGTTLPNRLLGYTRMFGFFYESDLSNKVAGCRVYILTDGELWFLDCNFVTEQVKTKVLEFEDYDIVDFNWAYDSLYYMLDNGEVYTIHYGEDDWDFKNPERFGGDKVFYALSHHTDELEGALSLNEGNYGAHIYSPYGE